MFFLLDPSSICDKRALENIYDQSNKDFVNASKTLYDLLTSTYGGSFAAIYGKNHDFFMFTGYKDPFCLLRLFNDTVKLVFFRLPQKSSTNRFICHDFWKSLKKHYRHSNNDVDKTVMDTYWELNRMETHLPDYIFVYCGYKHDYNTQYQNLKIDPYYEPRFFCPTNLTTTISCMSFKF